MSIVIILIGLLLIGMGFLVKKSPQLIAGYNTMSSEKQKKVDIEGLSNHMKNSLVTIGIVLIFSYFLFTLLGFPALANSMILVVTLFGTTVMVVMAQRFDHNKGKAKRNVLVYFLLGFVIVAVSLLIGYGFMPSRVIASQESVRFTGMYGFETKASEIQEIEWKSELPKISMRTNGFSFGTVNKGLFRLENSETVRLLLHSNKGPFLQITNKDSEKIYINFSDQAETEEAHRLLRELIEK